MTSPVVSPGLLSPLVVALLVTVAGPGWACPDCPTAQAVRRTLFDERFGGFFLVAALPLVIILACAAVLWTVRADDSFKID